MIELPVTLTSTGGAVSFASPVPLGYTKNKGVYRLLVTAEGEWEGLTIRCFWHLPGGADPASSLVQDGAVDVPASVTAHPGNGCITFEGSDGVKTVTSADLRYRVGSNSGTEDGTMPEPGTPAWEQLVSETAVALEALQKQIGNLDDLTTKAKATLVAAVNEAARTGSGGAGSMDLRVADGYVQYSTDSGVTWTNLIAVAELKGAKGDKGDPGNKGEPGAAGAPGKDGLTPHIGENGNWWIGDTDTGISAKGVKGNTGDKGEKGDTGPQGPVGPQGPQGAAGPQGPKGDTGDTGSQGPTGATGAQGPAGTNGKSAYQYAVEGGYTGTEEEFAAKIAEELPNKLPNPNALTFTGAVTGSYDGSEAVSVKIPSGGGGSGEGISWRLIRTINIVSGTSEYSFNTDNNGNAFKVKNFLILIDTYTASGYLEIKPNNNLSFIQKAEGLRNYPFSFMMKRATDGRYILEDSLTNNSIFERKISREYSSFGEFTSFGFWFAGAPISDTTMYILGEDIL